MAPQNKPYLKYKDFVERIDIDAVEEALDFETIHEEGDNDVGHCILPFGLHNNGDTTGKMGIHRTKMIYNCWVCFPADTLIHTEDGYQSIQEVQSRVLTKTGKFEVANLIERDYQGELVRIDAPALSETLRSTPDHPFWIQREGKFRWITAQNLRIGDYLVLGNHPRIDRSSIKVPKEFLGPQTTGPRRNGLTEFELTPDFLWMIGMYIAEGHGQTRCIGFSLHNEEIAYQKRLKTIFEGYGYTVTIKRQTSKPNSAWVMVHSSTLAEWFPKWLGRGCQNKTIPPELYQLPDAKLELIIKGFMDGDGHWPRDNATTTSRKLALQLSAPWRINGYPSISTAYPKNRKQTFTIENVTGFLTRRSKFPRNQKQEGQLRLAKINRLGVETFAGKVYNLNVEGEDNTYVVDNVVVHNCGGGSLLDLAMQVKGLDADAATDWLFQFTGDQTETTTEEFVDKVRGIMRATKKEAYTLPYYNENVLTKWQTEDHPWLTERGIPGEVARIFKVGYNPDSVKYAPKKDGKPISEPHRGEAIVLPHFWQGKLMGWQHRWLSDDRPKWCSKYTNTPDFPRQNTLFGYDLAKRVSADLNMAPVIVESVPTAIFLTGLGFPAIATFGAGFTDEQAYRLRIFQMGITLAPDKDEVGQEKYWKRAGELRKYVPVKWVEPHDSLPEKGDLGDLVYDPDLACKCIEDAKFLFSI